MQNRTLVMTKTAKKTIPFWGGIYSAYKKTTPGISNILSAAL